jgi:tetratricopeptide (TPR) repeat protein
MRAGEALEQDANDLRGAANLYRRVEILGERLAEAFYAQARVAASLGDTAEQARTLDKMFELAGTDAEPTPAQVDALYRLSEIFLGSESPRKQGFELLERAFAAEPRWAQAGRLLRVAAANDHTDDKVMVMFERVARNGGDNELLLDFLERRAALPSATPEQIKEAVDLAVSQGQEQRAEALLVRAVAAARDTADGLGSAPWAVLALAERRLAAGDLNQARDLIVRDRTDRRRRRDRRAGDADSRPRAGSPIAASTSRPTSTSSCASAIRPIAPSGSRCSTIYRETGDGDRLGSVVSARRSRT